MSIALLVFSLFFAGTAHYGAILMDRREGEVQRATAIGFFVGIGLGLSGLTLSLLPI